MKPDPQEERIRKCMNRSVNLRYWELSPALTKAEMILLGIICLQSTGDDFIEVAGLAGSTGMQPSAVSRLMKSLEERGMIERTVSSGNRRNVLVRATQAGRDQDGQNQAVIHEYWLEVLSGLPRRDVDEMLRIWEELLTSMETVLEKKKQNMQ